jgi:hypothetical protein
MHTQLCRLQTLPPARSRPLEFGDTSWMGAGELTPRNLGLAFGNAWAQTARPVELNAVKEGTVLDETWEAIMRAGMQQRLDEFRDRDNAYARFLEGFYDGVCAIVANDSRRGRRTRISHDMSGTGAARLTSPG